MKNSILKNKAACVLACHYISGSQPQISLLDICAPNYYSEDHKSSPSIHQLLHKLFKKCMLNDVDTEGQWSPLVYFAFILCPFPIMECKSTKVKMPFPLNCPHYKPSNAAESSFFSKIARKGQSRPKKVRIKSLLEPFSLSMTSEVESFIVYCNSPVYENEQKLSRGEICVANFKPPCEWCESRQV